MQFQVFNMNVYKLIAIMVFIIASILTMISIVVCWDGINSTISFDRAVSALIKCSLFIGVIWVIALSIVCVAGYYDNICKLNKSTKELENEIVEIKKLIDNRSSLKDYNKYIEGVLNNVSRDDRPTDTDENAATKVNVES
nr:MAG TPA: hypothetical protein [Caudoviricetes sp.]